MGAERNQNLAHGTPGGTLFLARHRHRAGGDQRLLGQRVLLDQVAAQRTPAHGKQNLVDRSAALDGCPQRLHARDRQRLRAQPPARGERTVQDGLRRRIRCDHPFARLVLARGRHRRQGLAPTGQRLEFGRRFDRRLRFACALGLVERHRPDRREATRRGLGRACVVSQAHAALAVELRVVDLLVDGIAPTLQAFYQVRLPQRARTVQPVDVQPRHEFTQLALAAWLGQGVQVQVVLDLDVVDDFRATLGLGLLLLRRRPQPVEALLGRLICLLGFLRHQLVIEGLGAHR